MKLGNSDWVLIDQARIGAFAQATVGMSDVGL